MVKNGRNSGHGGQGWSCAERRRRQNREYHDALSGWAWSKRALQMRRAKALQRIRNRAKET